MTRNSTRQASVRDAEIAVEQQHVDVVYDRLEELRAFAENREKAGYEHRSATVPGAQFERDVFVYNAAKRVADIDAQHEGLVFGRLDSDDDKTRHIGRLGLRDASYKPLLLDWRAPAAAPFYQATPTDRKGVIRRRVIRCSGQQVIDVTDDLLDNDATDVAVVGDGALMAALTRKRTGQMRDIVATIQAEQDAAIRAPGRGATVITGGPGTGKTVVALHRAAYLLYSDRRRYEGAGILIVGPSAVFMRYIERVLPSLGEDAAALFSLGELFPGVETTARDTAAVAAVKGSGRMRKLLARAARLRPVDAPRQLSIVYKGEVLRLEAEELDGLRRQVHAKGLKPNAAKTEAGRALLVALWRQAKPLIDNLVPAEFSRELGGRNEFLAFLDRWWPLLKPTDILPTLADRRRLATAASGVLSRSETNLLATSFGTGEFTISDVPLLDELDQILGRPPKSPHSNRESGVAELSTIQDRMFTRAARAHRGPDYDGYAHIIVDEAQDLSPMQWRMLGRRGQLAGWTIVGDAAQSSWPDPSESRAAERAALGRGPRHRFHLSTNYRNSAEIFDYAAEIVRREVPNADIPQAVRSTGIEPKEVSVAAPDLLAEVSRQVTEALSQVEGTVGVVATPQRQTELAAAFAEEERVLLVGPLESKGLEYDAVVVVDFDAIVRDYTIRVGYVVLTRATQLMIRIDPT
ncbi:HelD family protein [Stackebrandtia nassauensis]|uniref:Superfamily I DNA and RNA helicase-like protein n=1 Tax=Stackebrandtia nassauensis (strain DSM 44728 / CIP 108903 / NRRL B-16338 / NBRC 102104 / LLR-40K-21) TaxID=446470 RepID=D3PYY5_STANL|nr:AAA family ATPase [Stackebrandtia nassauensis]ADD45414.1 Superfamily I DNA and RNA helicase-like protein [Stackebrandtia nassauensis DSM 44728]